MSKKILIVEDEPMVLNLCAAVLDRLGFDTVLAKNGVDGLREYRGHHKEMCLVLSDVALPVMGGIEMVRKIFELDPHSNVIMMSGTISPSLFPRKMESFARLYRSPSPQGD